MIIEKNTAPEEDEFHEYPYYIADSSLAQNDDILKHNIPITDL